MDYRRQQGKVKEKMGLSAVFSHYSSVFVHVIIIKAPSEVRIHQFLKTTITCNSRRKKKKSIKTRDLQLVVF